MSVVTLHRPVDNPVSYTGARQQRIQKVADMAGVLLFYGAYADQGEAIITLVACGYPTDEIVALLDDARQVATEHVVAMQMSRP